MNNSLRVFVREHHAQYLLFFPIYFFLWFWTEKLAVGRAYIVHSVVDDVIPFCELFTALYFLWYPFWIGMMVYCFICEPDSFLGMIRYIMLSFSVCIIIYSLFPTAVDFRPTVFERRNILVSLTEFLYKIDEPTNVCPSEHVIGAFSVLFAAIDTKRFRSAKWVIPIAVIAVLISISILFTKQHSFWDLLAALPMCVIFWLVCFKPWKGKNNKTVS